MKTIFYLAFPRSLSSFVAKQTVKSLQFKSPEEPSCEVLIERYGAPKDVNHRKDMNDAYIYKNILNKFKYNHVIKDVNQPYVATQLLKDYNFNTVFIERPLADNIYCMFKNGWFWAINYLLDQEETKKIKEGLKTHWNGIGRKFKPTTYHREVVLPKLIEAVIAVDKECYSNITTRLKYNQLITNPAHLYSTLKSLGYNPKRTNYIDQNFKNKRAEVEEYRSKDLWKHIDSELRNILNDADNPR